MNSNTFKDQILEGIPSKIPANKEVEKGINHAPKRKQILSDEERKLALQNALRYFPKDQHNELAPEFLNELNTLGRLYMLRYRPDYLWRKRCCFPELDTVPIDNEIPC